MQVDFLLLDEYLVEAGGWRSIIMDEGDEKKSSTLWKYTNPWFNSLNNLNSV